MSAKHLLFEAAAREKLLRGATTLYDAIRVTLGPKSKCVLIGRKWGEPLVCNDGVTIAKEMELADPEENLGARMIRQAAERTGDAVGDGTSTSSILAYGIFAEGLRNIAAGASAIDIKRGLERGVRVAVARLRDLARPVKTHKERVQVATISAHNDASIGALVAQAVEKVGEEGVISVEEAKGTETSLEIVEGLQFDRGYLSAYFITDPERRECVLEDAVILLHEKKLSSLRDLLPLLEQVAKAGLPLLIVSDDIEGEALAALVVNRLQGTLRCCAVKAPAFGDRKRTMLEDLAIVTGGELLAEETGKKLESMQLGQLGRARRVIVDRDSTTVVGGGGARAAIDGRIAQLRQEIDESTSDYDREKLRERLGKLKGGVAVVHVGAPTEAELKSRKEAFDDAISTTKAAISEGIVPGAGLALLRAADALAKEEESAEGDERNGLRILRHALGMPTRQLAANSGFDGGVVVDRMRSDNGVRGFDAARGEYVDLLEAGIVDATKVLRIALENAVSVASVLLLTEATLTDLPEEKKERTSPEFEG